MDFGTPRCRWITSKGAPCAQDALLQTSHKRRKNDPVVLVPFCEKHLKKQFERLGGKDAWTLCEIFSCYQWTDDPVNKTCDHHGGTSFLGGNMIKTELRNLYFRVNKKGIKSIHIAPQGA